MSIVLIYVFFPLLNFIILNFFRFLLTKNHAIFIACLNMFYSLAIVIYFLIQNLLDLNTIEVNIGSWITADILNLNWCFLLDRLTWFMSLIVVGVSSLVHMYSCSYMSEDPKLIKFISYLSLFTFFMLMLVTANNFIQLFIGWEGVGLCSYLLINFWFTRIQANKSALKAIFVNRIGDTGVFLAIFLIFYNFRSFNFHEIFPLIPFFIDQKTNFFFFEFNTIEVICFLLTVGSLAKSAQLFLHTWLPDAMEGPTPVSALIHAATMVTAGIFLIIRCSFMFEFAPGTLKFISIIGVLTAFFGASTALCQNDIKKIIAYSTCSQLGYMFFACGISNYSGSLFHLINHAFFKALLFLTAGVIIHGFVNEQDIRKMGSLLNFFVVSYGFFSIGSLALAGFPFLSGYYSKDFIIESAWTANSNYSLFFFIMLILSSFCTTSYSIRLMYLVFFTKPNFFKSFIKNMHDSNWFFSIPLTVLSFGSILTGYIFRDIFIGSGSDFFKQSIFTLYENNSSIINEFIPVSIKLIPFFVLFISFFFVVVFYSKVVSISQRLNTNLIKIYNFLNRKYYFDYIYNKLIVEKALRLITNNFPKHLDKGILEWVGPTGSINSVYFLIGFQKRLQKGYIFNYVIFNILVIAILMFFVDIFN